MDEMDDEIDLRDIFRVLWKNRLLIAGIFMVAVVAAGAISLATPSVYRASYMVSLGNFGDPMFTDFSITKEYLLSDGVLSEAVDQLNLDIQPENLKSLKESIKITPVKDRVFKISIETNDQKNATAILQKIVSIYINDSEKSYNKYKSIVYDKLINTQNSMLRLEEDINRTHAVLRELGGPSEILEETEEMRYSRVLELLNSEEKMHAELQSQYLDLKERLELMENAEIIELSEMPSEPITRRMLPIAVAGMLGLMLGVFAAFLRESLSRSK